MLFIACVCYWCARTTYEEKMEVEVYVCVFGQGRRGLTIPKDSYKTRAHRNLLSNFTELPVHAKGMVVKWSL